VSIPTIVMRDIKTLDLNLLKVLNALLEERSVTRAAARLGLTQPAVSGILLRLREGFGDPLLVRAHRGMVPTGRALELAPSIRRVLADIEGLLQPPSFDPVAADLTFNLAASDYALSVILQPFFAALRQHAPGIRTVVHPFARPGIAPLLESGAIDLALNAGSSDSSLHIQNLFEERFVCILREGHPASNREWSLDLFCSLDHALVAFDGSLEAFTDRALAEIERARRVVLSVANFMILPKLIASTDVVAVVPARLVMGMPGILQRPPPLPMPTFSLAMLWHERSHNDRAHAWIRSLLVDVCRNLHPS
jgi:DNA-binding transcriptional LysR family regulator